MTNKELRDKLRKFPDDMEVKIEVDEYFYAKCASPYKVQRLPIGEEFIAIGEFGKLYIETNMTIEEKAKLFSPYKPHEWQEGYGLFESGFVQGAEDQIKINENEMAKLNEEWKQNLAIQRAMLIDKAVAVLVESGVFGNMDSYGAKAFRKAMEE